MPLIIKEMQIKTTMKYHLKPVRKVSSKSLKTINAREAIEKRGPSYTVSRNINWLNYYGKQYGGFSKN